MNTSKFFTTTLILTDQFYRYLIDVSLGMLRGQWDEEIGSEKNLQSAYILKDTSVCFKCYIYDTNSKDQGVQRAQSLL